MENEPLQILLADDDDADRLIFKRALKELKIKTEVHTVNDGEQLMQYLQSGESPRPHLLFLDLNMPRKNGIECLMEIRSDNQLKDIAIAIYSTAASENDIEETFHQGANVYIAKPNDFNQLKTVLEKAVMTAHTYRSAPFKIENFLLRV